MITPDEIQHKEFTRVVRGYKEDEVDAFLDQLTVDLDRVLTENNALKETIRLLEGEIERHRVSESTIFQTLESAKELMNDISASAEKRAEILTKNAELDAERIRREARESVDRMHEESEEMTRRLAQFRTRFRNMLQNELERFDAISSNMFMESESEQMNYVPQGSTVVTSIPNRMTPKVSAAESMHATRNPNENLRNHTIKTPKGKG